jgi:predicted HicB family RNase H-like nuclease
MEDKKIVNVGIRMEKSLHENIKRMAEKDHRSLHGFIIKTLSDVVKESEQQS